jgi:hypothetical protein
MTGNRMCEMLHGDSGMPLRIKDIRRERGDTVGLKAVIQPNGAEKE